MQNESSRNEQGYSRFLGRWQFVAPIWQCVAFLRYIETYSSGTQIFANFANVYAIL